MKSIILASVLALSSIFAHAQTFRDWKVVQETDAVLQVPVCRAYTQVASNLSVPIELSLSFPTAFDKVPTMILKVPANSQIQRAIVPLTARELEELLIFETVTDPSQKDKLWYVPIQMAKMVDIIIGNSTLPLKFTLANKEENGRISLTGSTAALNQIARCLKVNEILPTKFFRELNTAAGDATLGPDQSVAQLMIYVDQAFAHFREIAKSDADLIKLRASMQPLVKQETDAQRALNTAQDNLNRATTLADTTREKIRLGEERLQLIPGEIQALQQQKPAADQLLAQKKAIYDPLRAEKSRLQRAIDSAESDVSSFESAIRNRERLIREKQNEIGELQREASRLDQEIDGYDREMSRLERRKSELESDLASYNIEVEKQKILNSNGHYQNLKNEKSNLPPQIRQKRQELNQAENRLQRAEEALRRCKASGTTPNCDREKNEVTQAQTQLNTAQETLRRCEGRPGNDCRQKEAAVQRAQNQMRRAEEALRRCQAGGEDTIGKPGQGKPDCSRQQAQLDQAKTQLAQAEQELNECKSNVAPDCSNERREVQQAQAQLNRAQQALRTCEANVVVPRCEAEEAEVNRTRRDVNRLQSELTSLENRLNSIESEISRIETDAQNQAIRGHDLLAQELRRVAGELADVRSRKQRAQERFQSINNFEIPSRQDQISRAQGELPGLRRDLANAQRDLANAEAELRRWLTSSDFDRIEKEYLAAKKAVDDIVSGITSRQNEQTQLNRNLPNWRTQLVTQEREVARLTPLRDAARVKLDGIQAQLKPLRDQEKTITDLLAALKIQYEELRKLYQTLAKQLLGP